MRETALSLMVRCLGILPLPEGSMRAVPALRGLARQISTTRLTRREIVSSLTFPNILLSDWRKCMRTNLRCGLLMAVVMGALSLPGLQAQGNPAVGLWKNEDATKTVFIRTYEENGKLVGKVEKLIKG